MGNLLLLLIKAVKADCIYQDCATVHNL